MDHYHEEEQQDLFGGSDSTTLRNTMADAIFDSFGVLEHILSYVDAVPDLVNSSLVNHRWKEASRSDELWEAAIPRLWETKIGVGSPLMKTTTPRDLARARNSASRPDHNGENEEGKTDADDDENDEDGNRTAISKKGSTPAHKSPPLLFWRSLFSKEALSKMSDEQIRSIFDHPLLKDKKELMDDIDESNKTELQRFLQVHMLDVMSDGGSSGCRRHHFFADLYFGSYACSVLDSKRQLITASELCTPYGFDMYFKIAEEEVDETDRAFLTRYDDNEGVLLYHHSTCYFEESPSRDFQIVLRENVHSYHPTDLKWRWLEVGKRIQVGPYPPLNIARRTKDWGWNLENQHVILHFRDK